MSQSTSRENAASRSISVSFGAVATSSLSVRYASEVPSLSSMRNPCAPPGWFIPMRVIFAGPMFQTGFVVVDEFELRGNVGRANWKVHAIEHRELPREHLLLVVRDRKDSQLVAAFPQRAEERQAEDVVPVDMREKQGQRPVRVALLSESPSSRMPVPASRITMLPSESCTSVHTVLPP